MALVLSIVLCLAMSSMSVFAAADYSITVNGAKAGETYTAYKMLDLSVNDPENPTAYRYTVNSAWTAFAETNEFKAVYTVDAQGYVTSTVSSEDTWSAKSALSILAEKAAAYAKANNITAAGSVTIAAGETSGKINLTSAGYYIVASTLGTRAMIDTTPANSAVTMNEKNSVDTITKEVQEDSTSTWGENNDAQIGDIVNFKSKVTVVPRTVNLVIHDTMDRGLTFSGNDSIKLYTDAECSQALASGMYTIKDTPDNGDTFTIKISDDYAKSTTSDADIYITYTAKLNKEAITSAPAIQAQDNTTKVSFGNGTESTVDKTTTTTHKFAVRKYDKKTNKRLAGAVFQVKKGGNVVNLIKLDDMNYRVADAKETGTPSSHANDGEINTVSANSLVSDFVTVASENIVIWGVDSDNDYSLVEIQPPKGYNKLAEAVSVTVEANNTTVVEVGNSAGVELPSTGGMGTTIFYILGALLVIVCGIVLVARRRMAAK